jgi:hypothetical protein
MSNDKSKKTDSEVSLTRRTVIKTAAWIVPVILAVQLPKGNVFVHASTGGQSLPDSGGGGF